MSNEGYVESKKNTRVAIKARLCVWRGKASDEVCGKQRNTRQAKTRLCVWRGKASDEGCVKSKKNARPSGNFGVSYQAL